VWVGVECAGDGDTTCKADDADETIGRMVEESVIGGGGNGVDDAARRKMCSGDEEERVGVEIKASSSTDKVNVDGESDVVGCGSSDNDNCDCGCGCGCDCDCGCGTGCVDDTEGSMVLRVDLASREGAPARGAAVCNNACAEDSNAAKDAEDAEDASDGTGDTAVDGNAGSTGRFTGVVVETGDNTDDASGVGGRSDDEEESLSVEKSFEATVA
jgi:hypothetical protein